MTEPEERRKPNGSRGDRADPTRNVLDLVDAAVLRQDDLRIVGERNAKEQADLRAEYEDKLRKAETARIDAIRAVDVGNVQRAAEVQATQALTLANQVTTSAEALRASQADAASLADGKLVAALEPIQKRIDDLSRAQYEAQGQKTQVVETQARGASGGMWIGITIGGMSLLISAVAVIAVLASQP